MATSNQIFLRWFKEYYSHEFTSLSREFKNQIIEKVLFDNSKYITKEMVLEIDGCVQCGRCCEGQRCLDFDDKTKLCTRHDNPIHEFCTLYPWGSDEYGIAPLTINCSYMVKVFVTYFDNYFQKCIDEGVGDAQRSD